MADPFGIAGRIWSKNLSYLIFQITSKCNAACEHCFNWRNTQDPNRLKDRELSLDEIETLTKKLPPMLLVNLCGGEPTLRNDLPEIVSLFNRNTGAKYITIPTNGFLPHRTEEIFGRIFSENPETFFRLGISLDGWEEEHDRIRRHPGGFQKVLTTAGKLRELKSRYTNFFAEANIVFSKDTQDSIGDLVKRIHSTELFDSIAVLYIRGNPKDPELLQPDLEKYREINHLITETFRIKRHPSARVLEALTEMVVETVIKAEKTHTNCYRCFAADRFAVLNARGDLYPCEILDDRLIGNIRNWEYDIPAMLESKVAQDIREWARTCVCTWECAINMSFIYQPLQSLRVVARALSNAIHSR
jgi:MoaA/NifB/PqqE/SkfB family radical SAM enzyme